MTAIFNVIRGGKPAHIDAGYGLAATERPMFRIYDCEIPSNYPALQVLCSDLNAIPANGVSPKVFAAYNVIATDLSGSYTPVAVQTSWTPVGGNASYILNSRHILDIRGTQVLAGAYSAALLGMLRYKATAGSLAAGNAGYFTLDVDTGAATLAIGRGIYVQVAASNVNAIITAGHTLFLNNSYGTGTIVSYSGITITEHSRLSTNAVNALIGSDTIPTNRWSLYNISTRNNLMCGPTINCAPNKEDEFLGDITWSVGAAGAGIKWRLTLAGAGAIAQIAGARGGIISITSTIATPSWLDEYANNGWSVQDYPVLYCRFRTLETVNTMKAAGFTDAVNGAGNLPWTTNAILITVDTSIGNFFYLTGVVAAARVNVSTTVALDANYHTFMLTPYYTTDGAYDGYDLWVDGVYKCSLPQANLPAVGTMMQALPAYAGNLGGAVMSTIYVDTVKFSQRRNTGTAA